MLPWLFPVGLLGAVALLSLSSVLGEFLALGWAWIAFPVAALFVCSRARGRDRHSDGETQYYRTRMM